MKAHSMIFENFFDDPVRAKALIDMGEMRDEKYEDGVTYPNIIRLPDSVRDEIGQKMQFAVGPGFREILSFGRYSFEATEPPHWAHSDFNISQYLALIYLSRPVGLWHRHPGTQLLKHTVLGFERHPDNELYKDALLNDANRKDMWEVTYECPAKYNRVFILDAAMIHAAGPAYGSNKEDGRLVVSVFFNLEYT